MDNPRQAARAERAARLGAAASSIAAKSARSSHIRCRALCHVPRLVAIASAAGLAVTRSRSRLASSFSLAQESEEAENPFAADFEGDMFIDRFFLRHDRRLQAQQQAAVDDALGDLIEKSGIAVLMSEAAAAPTLPCGPFNHRGGLGRGLRALPASPGLGFDERQLADFFLAGRIEIADRRLAPFAPDLVEIAGDGGLRDPYMSGDRCLRPSFEEQIGHRLAAIGHLSPGKPLHATFPFINVPPFGRGQGGHFRFQITAHRGDAAVTIPPSAPIASRRRTVYLLFKKIKILSI